MYSDTILSLPESRVMSDDSLQTASIACEACRRKKCKVGVASILDVQFTQVH